MIAIGTKVIADDGFSKKLGTVTEHVTTRWGEHHVVEMSDGTQETAHNISEATRRGIGWKIATEADIAFATKYPENSNGGYSRETDGDYTAWLVANNRD